MLYLFIYLFQKHCCLKLLFTVKIFINIAMNFFSLRCECDRVPQRQGGVSGEGHAAAAGRARQAAAHHPGHQGTACPALPCLA
jgi:hypothetical protein